MKAQYDADQIAQAICDATEFLCKRLPDNSSEITGAAETISAAISDAAKDIAEALEKMAKAIEGLDTSG